MWQVHVHLKLEQGLVGRSKVRSRDKSLIMRLKIKSTNQNLSIKTSENIETKSKIKILTDQNSDPHIQTEISRLKLNRHIKTKINRSKLR